MTPPRQHRTCADSVCGRHRSPVPDLLFEDIQDARIDDIRDHLDDPETLHAGTPLHRVTVFLTYRCNLRCPYCKTIARNADDLRRFPQKAATYSYQDFVTLLDSLQPTPLRHLHFTGGEATLLRDLPRMVALARARGIEHLSITSNGTAPVATLMALVESGIDEIRISIDARDPQMGAALTGRSQAWDAAVRNLHALAACRQRSLSFFLVANTVISQTNRRDMVEIVRFLIDLGVDDIKLITVVDEKETLGDFTEAPLLLARIHEMLRAYPNDAFPLLRRKLATVFSRESIGLDDVVAAQPRDWRCYIPLTERTVDGVSYYPCSVYLREGGAPLGSILDDASVQRAAIAHFVRHGRCLEDPICRQYCLHCTKNFNVAANASRLAGPEPLDE